MSCRTPSFKLSRPLLSGSRQLFTANLCGPLFTYYACVDVAYVAAGDVTNHVVCITSSLKLSSSRRRSKRQTGFVENSTGPYLVRRIYMNSDGPFC